jgi:tetratricopeptide (TPR) repeat protein/tRNA A-37 threonylcarbamoyl transferase component Bud32
MNPDFGEYQLVEEIGSGTQATVYLARHKALDIPIVLKVLKSELAEDRKFVERFEREARTMARMPHENIVRVTDYKEIQGQYCIAMEYVDGIDLRRWIKKHGTPPVEIAVLMFRDICRGLASAHGSKPPVIHRDIKPANMMFACTGTIKIMDFGLARDGVQSVELTMADTLMGTPAYMSPEQAERRNRDLDARSDVFSSGILGYELLGGRRPFAGGDREEVLEAIRTKEPLWLGQVNPEVPEEAVRIVHRMLEKDLSRRPANAIEIHGELEDLVEKLRLERRKNWLRDYYERPDEIEESLHPKRLARHLAAGIELAGAGAERFEDALRELRRALELDPANAVAREHLARLQSRHLELAAGYARTETDRFDDALRELRRVLFLDPGNPQAAAIQRELQERHLASAASLQQQGRLDEAERELHRVLSLEPADRAAAARLAAIRQARAAEIEKTQALPAAMAEAAAASSSSTRPTGAAAAMAPGVGESDTSRTRIMTPEQVRSALAEPPGVTSSPAPAGKETPAPAPAPQRAPAPSAGLDARSGNGAPAFDQAPAGGRGAMPGPPPNQLLKRVAALIVALLLVLVMIAVFRAGADATLALEVTPADAHVILDGERVERDSRGVIHKIPDGSHTVRVEREGYQPQSRTLSFRRGQTVRASFALQPMASTPQGSPTAAPATPVPSRDSIATLIVRMQPGDARVLVDGARQSPDAGGAIRDLPARGHRVRVEKPGYAAWSRWIMLAPGQERRLDIVLQPALADTTPGVLIVQGAPAARYYVDGMLLTPSYRPFGVFAVPPGRHSIMAKASEYARHQKTWTITVTPRDTTRLSHRFPVGCLMVRSQGSPGRVEMWDYSTRSYRNQGETPREICELLDGEFRLRVARSGWVATPPETTVTVRGGQTTDVTFTLRRRR